jgi:hypothetical protein
VYIEIIVETQSNMDEILHFTENGMEFNPKNCSIYVQVKTIQGDR